MTKEIRTLGPYIGNWEIKPPETYINRETKFYYWESNQTKTGFCLFEAGIDSQPIMVFSPPRKINLNFLSSLSRGELLQLTVDPVFCFTLLKEQGIKPEKMTAKMAKIEQIGHYLLLLEAKGDGPEHQHYRFYYGTRYPAELTSFELQTGLTPASISQEKLVETLDYSS